MAKYKDFLQMLRDKVSAAQIKAVKADEKLFGEGNGPVDLSVYEEYQKAHSEWQCNLPIFRTGCKYTNADLV